MFKRIFMAEQSSEVAITFMDGFLKSEETTLKFVCDCLTVFAVLWS